MMDKIEKMRADIKERTNPDRIRAELERFQKAKYGNEARYKGKLVQGVTLPDKKDK